MGRQMMKQRALPTRRASGLRVAGRPVTPEKLIKVLDSMAELPVQAEAARQAGISTWTIRRYVHLSERGECALDPLTWRDLTGPFHELYKTADNTGLGLLEGDMFRRARGYREEITYQGRVLYKQDPDLLALGFEGADAWLLDPETGKPIPETIGKQSEELMMFLAKTRMREKYGSHQKVDVTHNGVIIVGVKKPPAQLEEMYGGEQVLPVIQFEDAEEEESSGGGSDE